MRRTWLAVSVVVLVAGVAGAVATWPSRAESSPCSGESIVSDHVERPVGRGVSGRWVIRDLGTLGGTYSEASGIDDRGHVVGLATTADGEETAFSWENGKMVAATAAGEAAHGSLQENGTVTDLGALPGGDWSEARASNDRGQIVGVAATTATDTTGVTPVIVHAFLWEDGKMHDLGTLGGPESEANAINDRGQVVGVAGTKQKGLFGEPIEHAFLWESGKMRDLGTLGGAYSAAFGINDRGQVVGEADTELGSGWEHAFLWENGKMRDLGTLGGPNAKSSATAINERGQIVGKSPRWDEFHAVLWTWQPAS